MGKTAFKTFATFTVLLLIVATAFTLIFGLCDAHIFAPLDIASATSAEATTSADYYASVESLSTNGASFRSSLAKLIGPSSNGGTHKSQPTYKNLIKVFPDTDANPDNESQMLWFYTGTVAKSGTNREHVWPKDGGKAFPAESETGSDAHHLRPTDHDLNSTRQSYSFGEVKQISGNIVAEYGSKTYDNLCYLDKGLGLFYPGVGYRGATARILMYVQTRWGDQYNLQFVLGAGHCKTIGDIETLMKWHLEEPVTAAERLRNDEVQKIQGNRNPFIDHPEYAARIYCYDEKSYNTALQAVVAGTNNEPISGLAFNEKAISIALGETKSLSPVYTPSNAKREVEWKSSDTTVATVDSYGKITAKKNGTTTITVSAKATPSIKATITVTVKSVSSISVSGQPTKKTYNEGEVFAPSGVTVTAHFSDGSTSPIDNASCKWVDAVTGQTTLSTGTTSVICKFTSNGQTFEDVVNGITVKKISGGGKATITLDKTNAETKYDWYGWSADGLSGQALMYKGKAIQFNSRQGKCYIFNTTPVPNSIISITIKVTSDSKSPNFEILTSTVPYTTGSAFPTTGTKRGTITADTNGKTLTLNTTDKYFTINYTGTGACYIESIEILYGEQEAECVHAWSAWTVTKQPTTTQKGTEERTCSKCNAKESRDVPMLVCDHAWGEWTVTKEATYTETGSKYHTCSKCNKTETETIDKLVCPGHNYGEWTTTIEPTIFETGEKERVCSICNHKETQVLPKLENPLGDVTAEDFVNAVNAIDNAATIEEKEAALKYAQDVFNALPSIEKLKDETQNAFGLLNQKQQAFTKELQTADSGLSGGEIAGICVGCVFGAALIGVIVYIIIKRKKVVVK